MPHQLLLHPNWRSGILQSPAPSLWLRPDCSPLLPRASRRQTFRASELRPATSRSARLQSRPLHAGFPVNTEAEFHLMLVELKAGFSNSIRFD
jgi:hypothetical protein